MKDAPSLSLESVNCGPVYNQSWSDFLEFDADWAIQADRLLEV